MEIQNRLLEKYQIIQNKVKAMKKIKSAQREGRVKTSNSLIFKEFSVPPTVGYPKKPLR